MQTNNSHQRTINNRERDVKVPGNYARIFAASVVSLVGITGLSSASAVSRAASPTTTVPTTTKLSTTIASLSVTSVPPTTTAPNTTTTTTAKPLAGDSELSTLTRALQLTGLDEKLRSSAHTLFAPTNLAFDVLPLLTVEGLLKPEKKDELTKLLQQHIVPGRFGSGALARSAAGFGPAKTPDPSIIYTNTPLVAGGTLSTSVTITAPPQTSPPFKTLYPSEQFATKKYSADFVASTTNPSPGVFVTLDGKKITIRTEVVVEQIRVYSQLYSTPTEHMYVGKGQVLSSDISLGQSVIHKIDTLLLP
jgi:uncharacterized surface protein with fasciclin (FAS1) repeats